MDCCALCEQVLRLIAAAKLIHQTLLPQRQEGFLLLGHNVSCTVMPQRLRDGSTKMAVRSCASWPVDVPGYVEEAVAVVDRALALWPHGELALSFNGGKDCTILLGLVQVRIISAAAL